MKLQGLIFTLLLTLVSNLSFTQADSLFGKEVIVHLHKAKKTITAEYRSYENNRVTVLFDNSLHDYFYPEVELLKFEEFDLRFDDKGKVIVDRFDIVEEPIVRSNVYDIIVVNEKERENYSDSITPSKNDTYTEKKLLLFSVYDSKEYVINLHKVVKIKLNNGTRLKSNWFSIKNDSTLLYQNQREISIKDVASIKCFKYQSKNFAALGTTMAIVGFATIPFPIAWIAGIPLLASAKYVKGYRSKKINGNWELLVD